MQDDLEQEVNYEVQIFNKKHKEWWGLPPTNIYENPSPLISDAVELKQIAENRLKDSDADKLTYNKVRLVKTTTNFEVIE